MATSIRRVDRARQRPGFFSPSRAFSDTSDFVPGATVTPSLAEPQALLPRTQAHQSLVQQELDRARGSGYHDRAILSQLRGGWGAAGPTYKSAPARALDLARRKRNVVVAARQHGIRLRSPTSRLFFSAPHRVSVCLSRRARREVLFAFNVGGSRGVGRSGVRRTLNSQWSC